MIDTQTMANWLSRLVQIPSVNPTQAGPRAGTPGEAKLAAAVATWFEQFGGQVQTQKVYPNRSNVYGIWRGQTKRWAALDIHMDTVTVEQMTGEPFSGHIADGRVYGRGAVDTKASLAVALALLEQMQRTKTVPMPNLLVAATVDEENAAQSAPAFARWVRRQKLPLDELMVAEPTSCRPVFGHKGSVRLKFTVHGQASHSSTPERGKNAITAASKLVAALVAEDERLRTRPTELGNPTLTVALINGGTGANVVPDRCEVTIDRRTVMDEEIAETIAHLKELAQKSCPLPFTVENLGAVTAFLQPPNSPWIQKLADWSGHAPVTAPYGTNAWAYGDLPGACVVFGPGSIDQAHGKEEWVEIAELEKLANIYTRWWGLL